MLTNIIAQLNKKQMFHVMETPSKVRVLTTANKNLGAKGKDLLRTYFGFDDFTVPASKEEEVKQKASDLKVNKGDPKKWNTDEEIKFDQEKQTERKKARSANKGKDRSPRTVKQKELSK